MISSNANALGVDLDLTERKKTMWNLSDIKQDKPVKVFSLFSCGGGSSMGYKKAGFDVVGNIELDTKANELYVENFHPKYNYNMDVRDFIGLDVPEELKEIDILDGSPPCTTFSDAGKREQTWGKVKKFREGQKLQTLDDLFMVYLDAVEKLRPKIFIAENVTGLIKGNARGYVNEILNKAQSLGYDVQMFQLNSAFMGVPQQRERIFFIGNRMGYPKLKLNFNEKPITYGEIKRGIGRPLSEESKRIVELALPYETSFRDVLNRTEGRNSRFSDKIYYDNTVPFTLTAQGATYCRADTKTHISTKDVLSIQTFPDDYNFKDQNPRYICGMSVPPIMMEKIAREIWNQWLDDNM